MGADQNIDWAAYATSTLDWWREAGVDASIDETPRNWLQSVAIARAAAEAPSADAQSLAAAPARAAPQVIAPSPMPSNLAEFEAWRVGVDAPEAGWPGKAITVEAAPGSPIMVLIDQPERDDVEAGVLMSGGVGRLFDRMLAAIGLDRSTIHLAALATKRPVSGRISPEIEVRLGEIARHHVALVAPKRLLLLGNAPSRALLGADAARMRGSLHVINADAGMIAGTQTQAIASFHPRFLLERPAAKAEAWKDLQMLMGNPSL